MKERIPTIGFDGIECALAEIENLILVVCRELEKCPTKKNEFTREELSIYAHNLPPYESVLTVALENVQELLQRIGEACEPEVTA